MKLLMVRPMEHPVEMDIFPCKSSAPVNYGGIKSPRIQPDICVFYGTELTG